MFNFQKLWTITLILIKRMIMLKSRMQVNKKLMILEFLSLNFVHSVANNSQLIVINFVASVAKRDIFESHFMYMGISILF